MELQRTPVDNTPLLVNLLRLIRDARSPNYKDHEKGPVTFHFGGLCMRDTGSYAEAEELWRCGSAAHNRNNGKSRGGGNRSQFRGPIHLAVYLNHSPVEVWTLQDFREPSTEHSVPRDFEQLEQLNTLVRVLFAHLRSQEIYGVVLQSCVTTADDVSGTQAGVFDGCVVSPSSLPVREANASSVRGPYSPVNNVSLRLFHNADDDLPRIAAAAQKRCLWSSEDFVRVDAVVNKTWRYQTAPPAPALLVAAEADAAATTAGAISGAVQDRSAPIKTNSSRASRTQTGDSDALSQSTSPEVPGSLAKSSLPTPHLAPTEKSSILALTDFALPPPELSEAVDGDLTRQSRSALGPPNSSIFASAIGNSAGRSNILVTPVPTAAVPQSIVRASAVGHLEDVMWLSDALHVRRMGTLDNVCEDAAAAPSPQPGASRKLGYTGDGGGGGGLMSSAPTQRQFGSLFAAASVGALSGLDLDGQLGWNDAELEGFNDEDDTLGEVRDLDAAQRSSPSNATTEQLISLLGLCSSVKLQHVAPAPFGDLVIALNLKDSSA
ncbi:hypothetical protein ABL78_0691 [Leptomonas seymouri]|uniref:Uncharacterized protein n=1 Tax=Leptomonas seymouri TaxID=5684 RepID=A0A0N1I9W6_LEPSE|nr:hypothetical protein ABL78_0691 [Leptomonas seymouri]|eukprot:KPI90173.1 hypothetical protein ABL78_0691 [Leptomonas seymouri]